MSLDAVAAYSGPLASAAPPRYISESDDSGNSSIIRLARLRFHCNLNETRRLVEAQSYANHPGMEDLAPSN